MMGKYNTVLLTFVVLLITTESESAELDIKVSTAQTIFEPDWLLMLDSSAADGLYTEDGLRQYNHGMRRARLGIDALLNDKVTLSFSIEAENDDSEIEVRKAALNYEFAENNTMEVGLIKQPFGLENNTSTRKIRTVERSMATNVFAPSKGLGISWHVIQGSLFMAAGAFIDPDDSRIYELSGRTAFAAVKKKRTILQFGVSAVYRDNDGQSFRIRDSGVFEAGKNFLKSGKYDTDHVTTIGLEAAWSKGPILIQSEWFNQSLSLNKGVAGRSPYFSGGYIHIGYAFNGSRRKFKGGRFGNLADDENGKALEVFSGIGLVDTVFEDKGDQAVEMLLGVNYQLSKHVRLAGQVQRVNATDDKGFKNSGDSAVVRLIVR